MQKGYVFIPELLEERNYAELPGVFDNKLIQELTARLADLQREQSRLSANFNPNYPRVKELQSQIDESKAMLEAERTRAAGGIANDYKAAVSHEEMLQKAFTEQERQANDIAGKSVQYNILKREADTNKQLYVGLLEKLKETGVSSSLKATNIRVVDPAYPPKKFARPRILLDLSITLIVGMCLGIAAAFLQEHLDNTLKSSKKTLNGFCEYLRLARCLRWSYLPIQGGSTDSRTMRRCWRLGSQTEQTGTTAAMEITDRRMAHDWRRHGTALKCRMAEGTRTGRWRRRFTDCGHRCCSRRRSVRQPTLLVTRCAAG